MALLVRVEEARSTHCHALLSQRREEQTARARETPVGARARAGGAVRVAGLAGAQLSRGVEPGWTHRHAAASAWVQDELGATRCAAGRGAVDALRAGGVAQLTAALGEVEARRAGGHARAERGSEVEGGRAGRALGLQGSRAAQTGGVAVLTDTRLVEEVAGRGTGGQTLAQRGEEHLVGGAGCAFAERGAVALAAAGVAARAGVGGRRVEALLRTHLHALVEPGHVLARGHAGAALAGLVPEAPQTRRVTLLALAL